MNNRGTAAIEFAIVLPVLVAFALGLVDLGRALWTQTTLDYAAQATARCAAIKTATCVTVSDAETYGQTQAYGLGGTTVSVIDAIVKVVNGKTECVKPIGTDIPNAKQATVTAGFTYFTPGLTHFSGTFSAQACYPT